MLTRSRLRRVRTISKIERCARRMALCLTMAAYVAVPALADPDHKINGGVTAGARIGNDTGEGFIDFVVPIISTGESIFFLNPRASLKDEGETELNLGLAYRAKIPNKDVILGANAYVDRRESRNGNTFDQTGVGLEFFSKWFDGRANYYRPNDSSVMIAEANVTDVDVSNSTSTSSSSKSTSSTKVIGTSTSGGGTTFAGNNITTGGATTTTTSLTTTTTTTKTTTKTTTTTTTTDSFFEQFEQGRKGWDAEIMAKLPLNTKFPQTRVGVGYYDYESGYNGSGISGWKARAEMRAGPYLTLDAEIFEDKELNNTGFFLGARIHIPFDMGKLFNGDNPFRGMKKNIEKFNKSLINERLDEMVIRDVRIQMEESDFLENKEREKQKVQVAVTSNTATSTKVSESTSQTQSTGAVTPLTDGGNPITVVHVDDDNVGDPNNGAGLDDGTFENPHIDVTSTNANALDANIVLVHGGSTVTGGDINADDIGF